MTTFSPFAAAVFKNELGQLVLTQAFNDYLRSLGGDPVVTLASLPVPVKGFRCYVDDATGGGAPCYADGVNWRRYSNDAIVS